MRMRLTVLCLAALLLAPVWPAGAQSGIGDIVYTVGTVVSNANGQNWAYILWQATEQDLISNAVFAVYAKPGDPTNVGNYVRQSIVRMETDARTIEPLLRRGANLGDDTNKLQDDLQGLFAGFIPSNTVSRADQLSAVMRGSLGDPRWYQNVLLLARGHPSVNLALGFADAELISAGKTTFEVRAYDPVQQQDLAVIGRVTVLAGSPVVLPAPGPPVQVPETSAKGDLNVRFRWGTPDDLRRLGLMQHGYDLYRVLPSYAESNGWNAGNPPPPMALTNLAWSQPWFVRRVNSVPITPGKLFEPADAANLTPPAGDTNTFFIMDDDGRGRPGYVNWGFSNGAQYYYYVAARDVLGRDGTVSSGTLATICDRMPPLPPTHVHVVNQYAYNPLTHTSNQNLCVIWHQNTNANDQVTNYWVYRWTNLPEMNLLSGDPNNNLIAIVPAIPGVTNNSYLDNGSGSPGSIGAYGETYWYTVRAGDSGACGQNLSGAAGPAFGVLRQRVGPVGGFGLIQINCLTPFVNFLGFTYSNLPSGDTTNFDLFLNCVSLDSRVQWASFTGVATYTGSSGQSLVVSNPLGNVYYSGGPAVSIWWQPSRTAPSKKQYLYTNVTLTVLCSAGLFNSGNVSDVVVANVNPFGTNQYADVEFDAYAQSIPVIATEGGPCNVNDPGAGVPGMSNIAVMVQPPAGAAEYRIYRRVDLGPLSLLSQGPVTNLNSAIECIEDAPPVLGGTICFYFQFLDANGNPGPLTFIPPCIDSKALMPLPVPVLAKITPLNTQSNPGMTLSWFCPPYGVTRFRVWIASETGMPNTNFQQLSGQLANLGDGPTQIPFTNNGTSLTRSFYSFLTPLVGPGFGNSGQFSVACNVDVDKLYYVGVQALDKQADNGENGNFRSFLWTPTNAVSLSVPWPARGLPSATPNFTAQAFFLAPTNPAGEFQWDSPSGTGVLVGSQFVGSAQLLFGKSNTPPYINGGYDPNAGLETNQYGDSIFPCAMYRMQVANANFPVTSGDAIQVSPLMGKIAWSSNYSVGAGSTTIIQDPFIGVSSSSGPGGNTVWYWIRDTQPQISGARYQYVLVHFNKVTREIDQLIPASQVDVP